MKKEKKPFMKPIIQQPKPHSTKVAQVNKIPRRPDGVNSTVGRVIENMSTFVRPTVTKPIFVSPTVKPIVVKPVVDKQEFRKPIGIRFEASKPGFVQAGVRMNGGFQPSAVNPKEGFKDNSCVEVKLSKPQRRRRNKQLKKLLESEQTNSFFKTSCFN
ncbi:hypothetical protein L1987_20634 [Smallanthus sonchifolius]|uniref:Uncharacterized protein n=1 Tax=Smallanthus sonchifolius TaxID=185202 RepID=A0ACB9ISP8_9ASTR|nr:hypothetical protein L1987_20634 [Smallanthus sonchifolius]